MKAFQNARVYVEGEGVITCDLAFDTHTRGFDAQGADIIPLFEGCVVVPGFIDTHIHGAGGADTMDATCEALATMADTVAKEGTTAFLATTMAQSEEHTKAALTAVAAYIKEARPSGALCLGAHMEGPYLSPKYAGAQPREYLQAPTIASFEEYCRAGEGCVRLVTIAPELDGALTLVSYISAHRMAVSIGHSDASDTDIRRAVTAGLNRVTHTYNAQRGLHHREIGVVGAALLYPQLCCELIADTIHVSVPAMKLLVRAKGAGGITLITDAMRAKGLGDCESELGGQTVYVRNGEARLSDGTLAGSVARMNEMVKNMTEVVGMSFTDAVDCATINPARALRIDDLRGSIKIGKCADYTVLDADMQVVMTIRDGNIIFTRT